MPSNIATPSSNGSLEASCQLRIVVESEPKAGSTNGIIDILLDSFSGRSLVDSVSVVDVFTSSCNSQVRRHLLDLTEESSRLLELVEEPQSSNGHHAIKESEATSAISESTLLEQSLKNQQAFISQLTHELRTPLAIAVGSLRRASLRSAEIPSNSAEHMQVASQELKRMARLIDHLTLLTDIDTNSQRWKVRPVRLDDVLTLWLEEISDEARRQLLVVVDENHCQLSIDIDPEALIIVLNNLLDNSLRYGPEGSPVVLFIDGQCDKLSLFIADWGYGIPQNLLEHVFDRFRRLEEHRDPARADGSGLGLAVSRALLQLMDGQICFLPFQSLNNPGDPSTIAKMVFPIVQRDTEAQALKLDRGLLKNNEVKPEVANQLFRCLDRVDTRISDFEN
jgi:signal transduction histidine kinase